MESVIIDTLQQAQSHMQVDEAGVSNHKSNGAQTHPVETPLRHSSSFAQIDALQILRAVAVILVAWLHIEQQLSLVSKNVFPTLGVMGVDIFFVISGFILGTAVLRTLRSAGPKVALNFLRKRIVRIFPIYWVCATMMALRLLRSHQSVDASYLSSLLLLPSPHYPHWKFLVDFSWTLVFEMFFYYALAGVQLFTTKRAVPALIILLSAAVAIGAIFSINRPYLIIAGNPVLLEFVFGLCISLLFKRASSAPLAGRFLALLGIAGAFTCMLFEHQAATGMHMIFVNAHVFRRVFTWGLASAALVAGIVLWSPKTSGPLSRTFVALGNASYSTYLFSALAIEFALRGALYLCRSQLPLNFELHVACFAAALTGVLGCGWFFYKYI